MKRKEESVYIYFTRETIPRGAFYDKYIKSLKEFLKKYPTAEAIDNAMLKKKYPDQFLIFNGFRYVKESLTPER